MKVDVTRLSHNGFDAARSTDDVTLPPLNGVPSARTHRTHVTEDGQFFRSCFSTRIQHVIVFYGKGIYILLIRHENCKNEVFYVRVVVMCLFCVLSL